MSADDLADADAELADAESDEALAALDEADALDALDELGWLEQLHPAMNAIDNIQPMQRTAITAESRFMFPPNFAENMLSIRLTI